MSTHWEDIAERLRGELAEFARLAGLFEEQQRLILKNDPDRVLQLGLAIREQVRVAEEHRRLREETVAGFASENGKAPKSGLRELFPLIAESARPLLKALVADVNRRLHQVRRSSRLNHRLLACSVDCNQELIRRLRPDAFTKTYAADGRVMVSRTLRPAALQTAG